MSHSTFSCDACGKQYTLRPELAGRKVKCKCGAVLIAPELVSEDASYELKDEPEARPGPTHRHPPPTQAASAETTPEPPTRPLVYQRRGIESQGPDPLSTVVHDTKRDLAIPLGLIGASALGLIVFLLIRGEVSLGEAPLGMLGVGIYTLAKTVLLVAAAFVVAPLLGVSFGPVWTAILKLAAIGLAPEVLSTVITQGLGFAGSGMIAWTISILFYWLLISYLFEMDPGDAWLVVLLFAVFKFLAGFGVMLILISMAN